MMKSSRFSEEQIIGNLSEHEAGTPTTEICEILDIERDVLQVEGKVRWIVPPQRSLTLKITPNFVTSKGFIFSRRSVSSESFPSASARARVRLSRGTVFSTLNALRGFFLWLATQPGYRSHLTPADAEYFALADKEARIAKTALQRGRCRRSSRSDMCWKACLPRPMSTCAIALLPRRRRQARSMLCALSQVG